MEPSQASIAPRLRLILGKFRVVKIHGTALGVDLRIHLGGDLHMDVTCPAIADVREGDLLTFYTEVLSHVKT